MVNGKRLLCAVTNQPSNAVFTYTVKFRDSFPCSRSAAVDAYPFFSWRCYISVDDFFPPQPCTGSWRSRTDKLSKTIYFLTYTRTIPECGAGGVVDDQRTVSG